MMSPEMGRAIFTLGLTILLPALWLLIFIVPPGSAGFTVTVLAACVGAIMIGLVAVIVRYLSP